MNIIFNLVIPVCVMVTLNVCIYRTMRRFRPPKQNIGGGERYKYSICGK